MAGPGERVSVEADSCSDQTCNTYSPQLDSYHTIMHTGQNFESGERLKVQDNVKSEIINQASFKYPLLKLSCGAQ